MKTSTGKQVTAYIVPLTSYSAANHPDMVGMVYEIPPSYVPVYPIDVTEQQLEALAREQNSIIQERAEKVKF
jgi:hypothetical protein